MADLSNADHVVVTDAVTRPAYNWLIYVGLYGLSAYSKIADLLVTNLAGWSAKWSADKNDVNLADPQLAPTSRRPQQAHAHGLVNTKHYIVDCTLPLADLHPPNSP